MRFVCFSFSLSSLPSTARGGSLQTLVNMSDSDKESPNGEKSLDVGRRRSSVQDINMNKNLDAKYVLLTRSLVPALVA